MSLFQLAEGGKKACHVKWAGKTIALGTFAPGEAEEKCARAKALTRAWRSTMRPKPSREWVMTNLERLGVRVVTRKGGDGDGKEVRQGDFDAQMQRRASGMGFSMMDGSDPMRRTSSLGLGQSVGLEDVVIPPHRPLVGGASAAAYEAARDDHYNNLAAKKGLDSEAMRRVSSLSSAKKLQSSSALTGGGPGMPGNSNQHYEMLKLHHMNLLNEIQETTLMMNLYQQQQLQQQRQQIQQQEVGLDSQGIGGVNATQLASLQQQSLGGSEFGSMYGTGSGLTGKLPGMGGMDAMGSRRSGSFEMGVASGGSSGADQLLQEQKSVEDRLNQIKDEIARRQREAEELELEAAAQDHEDGKSRKKRKTGERD